MVPPVRSCLAVAAASAVAALAAPAAAATLTFNGLIVDSCTVTLSSPGTMTPTPTGDEVSSTAPGGSPARALLLTTSARYRMVIDPPSGFATAPGGATPDSMSIGYRSTGVTVAATTSGLAPLDLGLGLSTVDVDITARKAAGAVFPAGTYRSDLVLRCEPR